MKGCSIDREAGEVVEMRMCDEIRRNMFANEMSCICRCCGMREWNTSEWSCGQGGDSDRWG